MKFWRAVGLSLTYLFIGAMCLGPRPARAQQFSSGGSTVVGGGSGVVATVGGVTQGSCKPNVTPVGNGADATDDTLMSCTLEANTLNQNGRAVIITWYGTLAANGNTKTATFNIGGTQIHSFSNVNNGGNFTQIWLMVRTGASAEVLIPLVNQVGGATDGIGQGTTLTLDTTAGIAINMTGKSGSSAASDVVQRLFMVQVLN